MDGARIQALSYRGYGIAAKKIGLDYAVYRPAGANDPLSPTNQVGTQKASFAPHGTNFQYGKPPRHGEVLFNGLFDATSIHVGDYFVSSVDTYLVLSLDQIQPPLCAKASRTMRFLRPQGADQPGLNPYGGNSADVEDEYMRGWPVSSEMAKLGSALGGLPGDAAPGAFEFLVPYAGVDIIAADIAVDASGNRYVIGASERSGYGWRLRAKQVVS